MDTLQGERHVGRGLVDVEQDLGESLCRFSLGVLEHLQ